MTDLPVLYKLTSVGAVQFWSIGVSHETDASYLVTRYGQCGTTSPQETRDPIKVGKNVGRANATTREQQAELEAKAKWEKQKKKGYVEAIDDAKAGKVDALIEGGILPMLAHKFVDHGHKIKFPCFAQPKLNGVRCIGIIEPGSVSLWSRTRNRFNSLPHIEAALLKHFPNHNLIFDGELYNHELKDDFNAIVSVIRHDEPVANCDIIQYHVYDIVSREPAVGRSAMVADLIGDDMAPLKPVRTDMVNEDEVGETFRLYRDLGYEGAMLRNVAGLYVNKRSYDLQKLKEFEDDDYIIVGIEEGRGRLVGHVGAFVCRMDDGEIFTVKLKGDTARLREHFENHALWDGKKMTVQHQGFTPDGLPLFPVGLAIRDYE